MKLELVQPFINAADAVLAESLQGATTMDDVTMTTDAYRRRGVAAIIQIHGDIEGRVIFDLETPTASSITRLLAGDFGSDESAIRETVAELANLIIGNAVTQLNDQGFRFKIHPPEVQFDDGTRPSEDTEALSMRFGTPAGDVHMNIAMRYHQRRKHDAD